MSKNAGVVVVVLAAFAVVAGAEQAGTLTATGPVLVGATEVPAAAAQSMMLQSGDSIDTLGAAAALSLAGGGRLELEKGTRATVTRAGAETRVCVDSGSLRYDLPAGIEVLLCTLNRPVRIEGTAAGTVAIVGEKVEVRAEKGMARMEEGATCACEADAGNGTPGKGAAAGGWTAKKKAVVAIIAAGATGGTVAGIVLATREEKPAAVSPVR
jgi:hypothetical protein